MTTKPQSHDSHPVCPTCQSDLSDREKLAYFASERDAPLANDDAYHLYEETSRLMYFLGALAQAGPLAVARYAEGVNSTPDWLEDFVGVTKELAEETRRRLSLLYKAGRIWKARAERTTASGKEG